MQVRDILFVDDLVDAFLLAQEHMDTQAGQAFNIGGGPENTTSLLELVDLIAELHGERPEIAFQEWRTGDQRYYVSDVRRFAQTTGWRPSVGVEVGVERLYRWLIDSRTPERAPTKRKVARPLATANALSGAAPPTGAFSDGEEVA
jgi:CDP-paratose 2-epimerase